MTGSRPLAGLRRCVTSLVEMLREAQILPGGDPDADIREGVDESLARMPARFAEVLAETEPLAKNRLVESVYLERDHGTSWTYSIRRSKGTSGGAPADAVSALELVVSHLVELKTLGWVRSFRMVADSGDWSVSVCADGVSRDSVRAVAYVRPGLDGLELGSFSLRYLRPT